MRSQKRSSVSRDTGGDSDSRRGLRCDLKRSSVSRDARVDLIEAERDEDAEISAKVWVEPVARRSGVAREYSATTAARAAATAKTKALHLRTL